MKIRPLNDRVLVLREEEAAKTRGGILIPGSAREKPKQGKVVAVGPGPRDKEGRRQSLEVRAGDKVLFARHAGTEIKIDDVAHLFMKEDDILGIIQ